MFKEAVLIVVLLFFFYLVIKKLSVRRPGLIIGLTGGLLILFCAGNLIYNQLFTFPDYYMDTKTGVYRYGTFRENLFAYNSEFRFQDEILFPILKNRTVLLDDSSDFYHKFFTMFSKDVQTVTLSVEERETLLSHKEDFDFSHEFTCIGTMNYVTEDIPEALVPTMDEKIYPWVYVNTSSLQGKEQLIALIDQEYNLYIMSVDYFKQIQEES